MNERIKNKALGSYLCLAAALVALITGIIFLSTQATAAPLGHDGIAPGVVLLIGAAAGILLFLFPVRFGALVQAVIYNVALYLVVVQLYFVFADIINKLTYAGGNAGLCVFYMAGTLVAAVLSVAACFFKQCKDDDRELPEAESKKRTVQGIGALAGVAVVAVVCAVVFAAPKAGPGNTPNNPSASGGGSEPAQLFQMKQAENTFAGKTIEELSAIPRADWVAKEANGQVAYFFEGQYTEGFSTIVDPGCLDMYCCKDGSMYGSWSGPTTSTARGTVQYVYGYWYNIDETGEENFVIHLTGTQNLDGTLRATNAESGEDMDVYIFENKNGVYDWTASMSFYMGMTRNVNIYGQEYTPAQSLTIDASNVRTFYTGDAFNPIELSASAVRGNGKEESIWGGRISYSGYDSETVGTKTVTGSFLGATSTFQVQVEQLVTEQYTGAYELVKDSVPTAMDATLLVDYSHKVCTVTAADGSAAVSGTLIDSSDSKLTMTLNGSEPLEVTISQADGVRQITIPAHQEKVSGWGWSETYDIGECTFTLVP